jgi:hypothetical protein
VGSGALSRGLKRLRLNANRSPPSNDKVKNEWGYTSTLPVCPHGM